MSATVNTKLFSDYFNQAPVLSIPGRTFPVKVQYGVSHGIQCGKCVCVWERLGPRVRKQCQVRARFRLSVHIVPDPAFDCDATPNGPYPPCLPQELYLEDALQVTSHQLRPNADWAKASRSQPWIPALPLMDAGIP